MARWRRAGGGKGNGSSIFGGEDFVRAGPTKWRIRKLAGEAVLRGRDVGRSEGEG